MLLNDRNSLYILDINPLSNIWFANIFSHSLSCNFAVDCIFWYREVLNFDMVQFIYFFPFVACAFGVIAKKPLPNQRSGRFFPMFSSKSFIGLALKFRSLIHSEFIFIHYTMLESSLIVYSYTFHFGLMICEHAILKVGGELSSQSCYWHLLAVGKSPKLLLPCAML